MGGEGLRIRMRGLEYMNDDPSEVDVLYAQIHMADGSDKLQVFNQMMNHFIDRPIDRSINESINQLMANELYSMNISID